MTLFKTISYIIPFALCVGRCSYRVVMGNFIWLKCTSTQSQPGIGKQSTLIKVRRNGTVSAVMRLTVGVYGETHILK